MSGKVMLRNTGMPCQPALTALTELQDISAELLELLRNSGDDAEVEALVERHSLGLAQVQQLAEAYPLTLTSEAASETLRQAVANVDEICTLIQQQLQMLGNELQRCSSLRRTLRNVTDSEASTAHTGFSLLG